MKRVLVVHGDIYGFGGAENHAVKVIRILQDCGLDVTVAHAGGPLDADRIERQMGVRLDPARVRFVQAPFFARFPRLNRGAILLRFAVVLRFARRLAPQYDAVIGTYGEMPIEARTLVQSMHIPIFFLDRESLSHLGVVDPGPLKWAVRAGYVLVSRLVAGWSRAAVERGVMLANSAWTAAQFRRHYPRGRVLAIHHGAHTDIEAGHPAYRSHAERANTMVIVGRVVPFKRVHLAVEIVDRLRARGHAIGLLVIGSGGGDYAEQLRALMQSRPHVTWRQGLGRAEMEQLIAGQRWGLHCAAFEHYGLAPLELQRLGCVTFVHDSGGQAEVVADARLKYRDVDDAVERIDAVLRDPALGAALFDALPANVALHRVEGHREAFIDLLRSLGVIESHP